jgi:hypothetical protein
MGEDGCQIPFRQRLMLALALARGIAGRRPRPDLCIDPAVETFDGLPTPDHFSGFIHSTPQLVPWYLCVENPSLRHLRCERQHPAELFKAL